RHQASMPPIPVPDIDYPLFVVPRLLNTLYKPLPLVQKAGYHKVEFSLSFLLLEICLALGPLRCYNISHIASILTNCLKNEVCKNQLNSNLNMIKPMPLTCKTFGTVTINRSKQPDYLSPNGNCCAENGYFCLVNPA